MSASPAVKARNRLATATRLGKTDEIKAARRDLAATKIEQYVKEVVADAPPLTAEQADRISALLRPAGGGQ
jgi:hypothetical protein